MVRADFIKLLATKLERTQKEAKEILDIVEESIIEVIKEDDELKLASGKFVGVDKPATTGRNPKDGSEVQIPAKRTIKWKAGKMAKEGVNA